MIYLRLILFLTIIGAMAACSTLTLKPADFAWPIESVMPVDDAGIVSENRYSFSFNSKGLFFEEMQDSSAYSGKELRVIRNTEGYYFITSTKFKNVYVFLADEGSMILQNKILISEAGLTKPIFNQRSPNIELVDENNIYNLTKNGIERGEK